MKNPNVVSDTLGEWFEVYNTTDTDITMCGYTIADRGTDTFDMTADLLVPAHGYAVLGRSTSTGTNGGLTVDYAYGSLFSLGNSGDEVVLTNHDLVSGVLTDELVDEVAYTTSGWPNPTGASLALKATAYSSTANDTGSNWCTATTRYGSGDLGTPGAANNCP